MEAVVDVTPIDLLKPIVTAAAQVIEKIQATKDNSDDCEEIVRMIHLSLQRVKLWVERGYGADGLAEVVNEYTTVLQESQKMLEKIVKRKAIRRFVWSAAHKKAIRKCKDSISEAQIRLLVDRTDEQNIKHKELRKELADRAIIQEIKQEEIHKDLVDRAISQEIKQEEMRKDLVDQALREGIKHDEFGKVVVARLDNLEIMGAESYYVTKINFCASVLFARGG